VAPITLEINLLSRIRNLTDELNIVAKLLDDQAKPLKAMDEIYKSIRKPINEQEKLETPKSVKKILSEEEKKKIRATMARLREPLGMSKANVEEINSMKKQVSDMIKRAEKAEKALGFLIDLKRGHNSVNDAQAAIQQGRTVLVFTLTTIIFLPLSFMASFFALNISQFQKNSEGELNLGYVSYIIFPVSSLVSATLIWIALNIEMIRKRWKEVTDIASRKCSQKTTEQDVRREGLTQAYRPTSNQTFQPLDLEANRIDWDC